MVDKDNNVVEDNSDFITNFSLYAVYRESELLNFKFENGYVISYTGTDTVVEIPSTYSVDEEGNAIEGNAYTVIGLKREFCYNPEVKTYILPKTIKYFESMCVKYTENLKEIVILNDEDVLTLINISSGLTDLGKQFFSLNELKTTNVKFYVPDNMYSLYLVDEYWSQYYSSNIYRLSERV